MENRHEYFPCQFNNKKSCHLDNKIPCHFNFNDQKRKVFYRFGNKRTIHGQKGLSKRKGNWFHNYQGSDGSWHNRRKTLNQAKEDQLNWRRTKQINFPRRKRKEELARKRKLVLEDKKSYSFDLPENIDWIFRHKAGRRGKRTKTTNGIKKTRIKELVFIFNSQF